MARHLQRSEVKRFRRRLLSWGRRNQATYPWRDEASPWLTLVAEIMLQRTRASQVDSAYREFAHRYPTPDSLLSDPSSAEKILSRLGLHFRLGLLLCIASAFKAWGDTPPQSLEQLTTLKGLGPYTAAVWLSLYRGIRQPIVDSNVARWLSRLMGQEYPRDPRNVIWINELADRLTPKRAVRDYTQAVLDLTMTVCTAREPRCRICPVQDWCNYFMTADVST